MPGLVSTVLSEGSANLRRRLIAIYARSPRRQYSHLGLGARRQPILLGTALLAYTFGLRHAVECRATDTKAAPREWTQLVELRFRNQT
jgi:hypothetical protein